MGTIKMAGQKYTDKQIEIARFAKALSNPARIAILEFLASQDTCFLAIFTKCCPLPKLRCHSIERIERGGTHSGRN
jgi:DNA-binding transcriptional ArsR family regulator